ncbi:hypothetical protein [Geothrix oryzae]|uniref:hypothetical protein n=1 Tax=Geothrix oryzae TaxID=2927975 RepID=UPI0025734C84|nr:hypothetical protein [Geothrix oryzae]
MNNSTPQSHSDDAASTKVSPTISEKQPITLAAYVQILHRASKEILPSLHETTGTEHRIIKELMDEGLLSDARITFGGPVAIVNAIVLTPAGASALAQWSDFLRKESFGYKIGDTILRVLWVLVGALCALLPDLIRKLP